MLLLIQGQMSLKYWLEIWNMMEKALVKWVYDLLIPAQ